MRIDQFKRFEEIDGLTAAGVRRAPSRICRLHYREALVLCEVEEMSYQETAEILSIPTETVMSRLARARKSVRESLLRASPAMRPGLSPIAIPSALTEKSVHLRGC
jgi:hypothetical protein